MTLGDVILIAIGLSMFIYAVISGSPPRDKKRSSERADENSKLNN
jgi:hypothetical protein